MLYKVIDLFAGAGGLTLGFTDSRFGGGFQSVLSVDFDKAASLTHERNFAGKSLCVDIEQWLSEEPEIPLADVVIGGPPCQGFSLLNKNRNGDLRRQLWEPFMDVVQYSKASAFVMENVAELFKSVEFELIVKRAKSMGFSVHAGILNSADYGVPQIRRRTVVIGTKTLDKGIVGLLPKKTHAKEGAGGLKPWKTVRDAISDLPKPVGTTLRPKPAPLDLHFGRNPTELSIRRYKLIPPGGNRFDLERRAPELTPDCWKRKKTGSTDLFGRLWWERPSVTIRTEFYKPEKGRYLHPDQNRPITHREAARLMGFPDDFVFIGSKIEIAKQIGNAVPPALAGAIAQSVLETLQSRSNLLREVV